MTKVLVATDKPFAKVAVDGIRKVVETAGFELVLLEKYTSQDEFKAAVADVDAVIIRSDIASKEIVDAAKNLKIIVRAGAGYDNIDLQACTDKGVVAMNTPGQNSNAVAELALGMMVMAARNNYDGTSGTELSGKKLGIHAYGNVGRLVAKIAKGFGMEIYAFDAFVPAESIKADGIIPVASVEELYSICQYVSLHIPATAETKKSINNSLLSKMPKGATLINTARAEVINEEELAKIMVERPDFKYYSDIEPKDKTLFSDEYKNRFFYTPKKMGAQTSEANINAGIAAAEQIVDFIKTGNKKFQVNK
jgi:D-3-phosphoglycerate dehydrogenase